MHKLLLTSLAALAVACSSTPPGKFPARPEGCDVQLFHETPTTPTENIGSVSATCGDDVSDDDCARTLKDQVCKLGGDVVWGVEDKPTMKLGKKHLSGRAAHTKTAPSE